MSTKEERALEEQLKANPKLHAFAIIAAVLQAVANFAAAVVLADGPRKAALRIVCDLAEAMAYLEYPADKVGEPEWVTTVRIAEQRLRDFSAPPDVKPHLVRFADKLAEAMAAGTGGK